MPSNWYPTTVSCVVLVRAMCWLATGLVFNPDPGSADAADESKNEEEKAMCPLTCTCLQLWHHHTVLILKVVESTVCSVHYLWAAFFLLDILLSTMNEEGKRLLCLWFRIITVPCWTNPCGVQIYILWFLQTWSKQHTCFYPLLGKRLSLRLCPNCSWRLEDTYSNYSVCCLNQWASCK